MHTRGNVHLCRELSLFENSVILSHIGLFEHLSIYRSELSQHYNKNIVSHHYGYIILLKSGLFDKFLTIDFFNPRRCEQHLNMIELIIKTESVLH